MTRLLATKDLIYVQLRLSHEEVDLFDDMARAFGITARGDLIRFLCRAHHEGLLIVMNKEAKQTLVGAAQEEMLRQARRVAEEVVRYELWAEGFRSDPYPR